MFEVRYMALYAKVVDGRSIGRDDGFYDHLEPRLFRLWANYPKYKGTSLEGWKTSVDGEFRRKMER